MYKERLFPRNRHTSKIIPEYDSIVLLKFSTIMDLQHSDLGTFELETTIKHTLESHVTIEHGSGSSEPLTVGHVQQINYGVKWLRYTRLHTLCPWAYNTMNHSQQASRCVAARSIKARNQHLPRFLAHNCTMSCTLKITPDNT